jgi:hypothetical protein
VGKVEKEIRLIDHFEDIAQNSYKVEFKEKRANRKLEVISLRNFPSSLCFASTKTILLMEML